MKKIIYVYLFVFLLSFSEEAMNRFSVEDYIEFGDKLLKKGDIENAIVVYEEGLKENSTNEELLLRIITVYQMENSELEEEDTIRIIEEKYSNSPSILFALASSYLKKDNKEKAFELFEKYIESNKEKESENIFFVGDLFFKEYLYEKSFKAFSSDKKENYKNLFGAAVTSRLLSNFNESIKYYEKLKKKKEDFSEIYLGLGIDHKMLGNYEKAKVNYIKFLELDKNEKVYSDLAILYMEDNDNTNAQKYVELGLKEFPDSKELRELLFEIFSRISN